MFLEYFASMLSPWQTRDIGRCGQIGLNIGDGGAEVVVKRNGRGRAEDVPSSGEGY